MAALTAGTGLDLAPSVPLNLACLLALLAACGVHALLNHTPLGLDIRALGLNPHAAAAAGISPARTVCITMALSGALAGLVGINEVMGYRYRFLDNFSPGYGFTGIAVALLGRNHPAGIVLAAILFGGLMRGGLLVDIYSDVISKDVVSVMQGMIILAVVSEGFWRRRHAG